MTKEEILRKLAEHVRDEAEKRGDERVASATIEELMEALRENLESDEGRALYRRKLS
jgi:nucleoid DNA-binding protein